MNKYMLAYHGGGMPETPEEGARVMKAWNDWYGALGDRLADGGSPLGRSMTVSKNGVQDGGGSNPLSGYTLVNADSHDAANEIAKGCPILDDGGTVEVCEIVEM
ncbi:YciI family protein [Devosia sp. Naph2]|uniref:YciI family protein n=1 Tax=Devosia polycyclovorans TaxID=3345148 RepID=UPI0035CF977F